LQEKIEGQNKKIGEKRIQFEEAPSLKASFVKNLKNEIGKFTFLRFSVKNNFLSCVSSLYPEFLFVLDLNTESLYSCIKFKKSISNLFWQPSDTLVIMCSGNALYFWNRTSLYVNERFYKGQFSFSNFEVSEDDECFLFRDNNKICVVTSGIWGKLEK
jgi:hypothetical protein